jgi:hypothetical protein
LGYTILTVVLFILEILFILRGEEQETREFEKVPRETERGGEIIDQFMMLHKKCLMIKSVT